MPRLHRTAWFGMLVVGVALLNLGCAPVLIGGLVAAGGATGYAYYAGEFKREFEAGAADVRLAARAALTDQGMVVMEEHSDPGGGWLVSRTPNGDRVSVTFNDFPDPNAPTGFVTRVGVRVAAFGDETYSKRLLDDIGARLGLGPPPSPAAPGQPPAAPPVATPTNRLVPHPVESGPPPLADSRPTPAASWGPPKK